MSEEIQEPMTALAENAVQLHELYMAYLEAGFPEDRAYDLTKTLMILHIQSVCDDDD